MTTAIIIWLSVVAVIAWFLVGFTKISANPPYIGQITRWGKRLPGKVKKEGWVWLPPFPFNYGIILIKMEKVTFEIVSEDSRTPDLATNKVPVAITYKPLVDKLIEFIDSGKEKGVLEQFTEKIQERIREWCMGDEEGPQTWQELNKSQLEATSVLVKKIAGNSIVEIKDYAQEVPTWIWLRFFSKPKPTVFMKTKKSGLKIIGQLVRNILAGLTPEQQRELEEDVEKRRKQISDLRIGMGTIQVEDLGIMITRLNIGNIDVLGEVAKKAEQEAKEKMERKAETLELQHVATRVSAVMKKLGCTVQEAIEVVQTERSKITKTVDEKKWNFSPETIEAIINFFKK